MTRAKNQLKFMITVWICNRRPRLRARHFDNRAKSNVFFTCTEIRRGTDEVRFSKN